MAVVTVVPSDSPPVRYEGRVWVRIGPRRGWATAQDVLPVPPLSGRVVDTYEIGRPISCVALSRDESCLYVADYDGTITALSAAAAAQLLAGGVARAVILHTPALGLWFGADGTRLTRRPDPVMPEDIISPVGAGDAFAAGCLYGIHESWEPDACLRLGHRGAQTFHCHA